MANPTCEDCGEPIGCGKGPQDGWELEDGRIVCNDCCIIDFIEICKCITYDDVTLH